MEKVTVDVLIESKAQDAPTEDSAQDSQDENEVKALSDSELREQLCAYGISPGPMLPSTRTIYEKKLLRLMKRCPTIAAAQKKGVGDSETDGEKEASEVSEVHEGLWSPPRARRNKGAASTAGTKEVLLETDNLKVTAECTSGLDDKPPIDMVDRQKKLLSPDVEYSLAKIVAELQEILPEGKGAAHRLQGQRRKIGSSPERNPKQKKAEIPCEDYGYPDANVSVGPSTRRRAVTLTPPSGQHRPEIKQRMVPETPNNGSLPKRVIIAVLTIFIFVAFVYVTM